MRPVLMFVLSFFYTHLFAQLLPNPVQLPNGWRLSPAGQGFQLGDLPLNMAVSKTNKYVAVTNNGQSVQSIQLIDTKQQRFYQQWLYQSPGMGFNSVTTNNFCMHPEVTTTG